MGGRANSSRGGIGSNQPPEGNTSGVGQLPEGATTNSPKVNRAVTGKRLNELSEFAVQYQRNHRQELKQHGIKRSGFITSWDGVGVHVWGFEGETKNGATYTSVLNNKFVTKFYTKGMNKLLGSKTYSNLDSAIKGAEAYLGNK